MSPFRSRVCSVNVSIDDTVQGHRKSTGANCRYEDPEKIDTIAVIEFFNRNEVANENERQRKQRMFDFYELSDLLEVHAFT